MKSWPADLRGIRFYLVGIKGTGMAAFAELLLSRGALVSGSDVADTFYTDTILAELQIPVAQGFAVVNLPDAADLVIHSAAYDPSSHPELVEATRRGWPVMVYTEALGAFSAGLDSSGVAGVHGKTTTTALCGTLTDALSLPGSVLVGSAVSNFGGRSTLVRGSEFFIAETCEYRRHFLHFHPRRIILTSVEMDHQDYFRDLDDIDSAFVEYAARLPEDGRLIHCADEAGAVRVAGKVARARPDVRLVPYGVAATGAFRIEASRQGDECQHFRLAGFDHDWVLRVPGRHNILNAAAALALVLAIHEDRGGRPDAASLSALARGLEGFHGSKRRSEILGDRDGVLYMDDYAHHPTAIRTTLEGLRAFYPKRRIVVDFMSHTYSRTAALLDEFASSFGAADVVVLHEIYPSAREKYDGTVTGRQLANLAANHHPAVRYFDKFAEAEPWLRGFLKPGDLFITMGAGDNWKLGKSLYQEALP